MSADTTQAKASPAPPQPRVASTWPRWQPFEWIVALRFLLEGRMQTAFIIMGVAIGVAVILFMSALLAGLQTNIVRRGLLGQAHIQVLPPKAVVRPLHEAANSSQAVQGAILQTPEQRVKSIDQWQALAAQIRGLPNVVVVSPSAAGAGLVLRGGSNRSINLQGIEPALYFRIVTMDDKLVAGSTRLAGTDILIGTELASDLGVRVGDKLHITTATGGDNTLTISGIFDLGNKGANARSTFLSLRTAQSLLGLPGGVSVLDVNVTDPYQAEVVAQAITAATGVVADSWIKVNAQFFVAINAQKSSSALIRAFVALSVAMGIASVLVVSVVQRSREIGILRAMGVTRPQVLRLFLIQGGLLGLGGAVAGSALGAAALFAWRLLVRNDDGTELFPIVLTPALLASGLVLATVTGLLAAFAPALRAARLDPVVAIRG